MNFNIKSEVDLYTNPTIIDYKQFKTDIPFLNDCLTVNGNGDCGFRTSRLYTILGCTGSGKSLFLLNLAQVLATEESPVLYISLENTEDQTLDRLESSGITPNANLFLSHPTKDPAFGLHDMFYASEVEREILEMEKEKKVSPRIIVLDYLGEVQPTSGKNSYEEYGNIAKELKELAKNKNICIITASQCNREALQMYKNAKTKEDQLKALYEISEAHVSDSIKVIHVSDTVLFVHRMKQYSFEGYAHGKVVPALFVSVLKNRDYSTSKEKIVIPYNTQFNRLSSYGVDFTGGIL